MAIDGKPPFFGEKGVQVKKLSARIGIFLLAASLTGCSPNGSGQTELNQSTGQLLPISALAIDTTASGYTMTVESIRQDSLEGDASPAYFSVEAESFADLFTRADQMLANRLYLMHARVVLISDDIARHRLAMLADSLLARPDARLTLRIAVTHGYTPDEVLRAEAISSGIPGVAMAGLLDQRASDGLVADCPLFRMVDQQLSGRPFALPVLTLSIDGHVAPGGSIQLKADGNMDSTGGTGHA